MAIVGNNIVIPSGTAVQKASSKEYSILGFRNALTTATITGPNEDSSYPFSFAIDYNDDTQYSPTIDSGTVTIEANLSGINSINYIGFAVHNAGSAGLTLTLQSYNGSTYDQVGIWGSFKDNNPFVIDFTANTANRYRIILTFTSKLYLGYLSIGEAIIFPRTPSLGLETGKYNRLDEVVNFNTSGNNVTRSRLLLKGSQTKGAFNFYSFDDLDDWYQDYQDHIHASKPLFFKWSKLKDDNIYGRQNMKNKPKIGYVNSFMTKFDFEFNGYAYR